ncbi:thioredoxin-domain-containing protein [Exidia glandulosa HHB12029]|uniref:protein disulfide-isomerase n=1 Tax=Exidia glandulosa HHB12029 TaxID=1314781 RepID=A0A165N5Y0_EXIGL|nr:thioredoxin-domain-containing protein [Exidia glandulosa HHB12029]
MRVRLSLFAASFATLAAASNVLETTSKTFDSLIGQGKPSLVEFFAPWCGHWKNLAPIYEQLADGFSRANDKVLIVKVDADGEGKEVASKHGVTGYPTLKCQFGPSDTTSSTPYEGAHRSVSDKTGVKSKIKPPAPPATLQLDYRSFDDTVYSEDKNLEKVAANFKTESHYVVANFDADAAQNKDIAGIFDVKSYPTIKFFARGSNKEPVAYEGGRSKEASPSREPMLDAFAAKFVESVGDARNDIYEAVAFATQSKIDAKHYIKVMEKVANSTEEYIVKETKRLSNILAKKTLSPEKLDEITIRANILASFVANKATEAEEAAESVIAKAKEEL